MKTIGKLSAAMLTTACLSAVEPANAANRWIIDTDMGIDDWSAILYTAMAPDTEIAAITASGNGLATCPIGAFNALRLMTLIGKAGDVPIGCGSPWPQDGFQAYPPPWRAGSETMMGLRLPLPAEAKGKAFPDAGRLMAETLRTAPEPISILSIGAMTTIATVLTTAPELKAKIRGIVAMAGAVDVPGNIRVPGFTDKNPNKVAEWNVYIDPKAAKTVFDSGVPLTLVPLDTTNKVPLRKEFVAGMKAGAKTPWEKFLVSVYKKILRSNSTGEYYQWDPLAAVVASKPDLCRMESRKLTVIAKAGNEPPPDVLVASFPLTAADGRLRTPLDAATAGGLTSEGAAATVNVCFGVVPTAFETQFISVLAKKK